MAALRQGKNRKVQVPVVAVVALKFQVEIPVLGWITKHQCGINELEIWWRFTLCTSHRYRLPGNACPSIFNDARLCILLTFFAHKIHRWNLRVSGLIPLQEGSSSCESWRGYIFFFEKWCICGFFGQQFWCYQICCHLVETMSGRRSSCCLGSRTWLVLAALCCAMQSDGMRLDSLTVATFLFVGFCVLRWLTVRYCLSCPISIIPSYPHYFIYDFPIFHSSMDWFKGKTTGKPHI